MIRLIVIDNALSFVSLWGKCFDVAWAVQFSVQTVQVANYIRKEYYNFISFSRILLIQFRGCICKYLYNITGRNMLLQQFLKKHKYFQDWISFLRSRNKYIPRKLLLTTRNVNVSFEFSSEENIILLVKCNSNGISINPNSPFSNILLFELNINIQLDYLAVISILRSSRGGRRSRWSAMIEFFISYLFLASWKMKISLQRYLDAKKKTRFETRFFFFFFFLYQWKPNLTCKRIRVSSDRYRGQTEKAAARLRWYKDLM